MKNRGIYALIFLFTSIFVEGQIKQFDLRNGSCQLYNGSIYTFGISVQKQKARLCVYKLDLKLNLLDSFFVDGSKNGAENYLQTYSDTLHDFLNIYFQKKEKKAVTVLRFNKKFELTATLENIDIARLNNTSLFSNETCYYKNTVYSIKIQNDTSGKQFYLNRYSLKSETENFDYEFKWQFPFERKNIHSAHVFFADKSLVLVFVNVEGGIKSGQWVLKINAETGKLEKASKLNEKGESNAYLYGTCFIDKNYKSICLAGQKFTAAQLDQKENKLAISNALSAILYYLELDSLGEISVRQDFKIPINDIKTGVKKTANSYLVRSEMLKKQADGGIFFVADIFKGVNSNLCYLYTNTTTFSLTPAEDKLILEKNTISPNLLVEQYYTSADKLDMNGKLCIDSLSQFEKLYYKPLTLPVKQAFKRDAEKNPLWILSKHTVNKNGVNFSLLGPVKKVYQLTNLEESNESGNPSFTALSNEAFIISTQTEEGKYQLKLYAW